MLVYKKHSFLGSALQLKNWYFSLIEVYLTALKSRGLSKKDNPEDQNSQFTICKF